MTEAEMQRQEAVVEAVLFTMGKSVETGLLAAALECTTAEAEAAAERLAKRYEANDRGVHLLRLENAWQLGTKREFYDALIRVAKEPRRQVLSQVVLETTRSTSWSSTDSSMKPEGWTLRGVQPSLRPPKNFCGASVWTRSRICPRSHRIRRRKFRKKSSGS